MCFSTKLHYKAPNYTISFSASKPMLSLSLLHTYFKTDYLKIEKIQNILIIFTMHLRNTFKIYMCTIFNSALGASSSGNCHQCLGSKGGTSRELMLRMCCAFLQATMVTWISDVLSVFKTCEKEGLKRLNIFVP